MYVKLDDVLIVLKTRWLNTRSIEVSDNIQQCINQIKKLPVEESVLTIRGEWIMHTNFDGYLNHYECSVCHQAQGHKSNYCEECGSDMREDY